MFASGDWSRGARTRCTAPNLMGVFKVTHCISQYGMNSPESVTCWAGVSPDRYPSRGLVETGFLGVGGVGLVSSVLLLVYINLTLFV